MPVDTLFFMFVALLIGTGAGVTLAGRWSRPPGPEVETRLPTQTFRAMVTALWSAKYVLEAELMGVPDKKAVAIALDEINTALGYGNGRAAAHDPKRKGPDVVAWPDRYEEEAIMHELRNRRA